MGLKIKTKSVLFYGLMAIVFFALIIVTLVALGSFASKNNDIKSNLASIFRVPNSSGCFLYAGGEFVRPQSGPDRNCEFVVAGEVILFLVGVALLAVSVVKAVLGADLFSLHLIAELSLLGVGMLIGLVTGCIISVGLSTTCGALRDSGIYPDNVGCSEYTLTSKSGDVLSFYKEFNSTLATTWIALVMMVCCALVYGVMLGLSCLCSGGKDKYDVKKPEKESAKTKTSTKEKHSDDKEVEDVEKSS